MTRSELQQSVTDHRFGAPFVLLRGKFGQKDGVIYQSPTRIIRADAPAEVTGALAAIDAAVAAGADTAGYFSYELGLLEPRLARLLPERRRVPLLLFRGLRRRRPGSAPTQPSSSRRRPACPVRRQTLRAERSARPRSASPPATSIQVNLTYGLGFDIAGDRFCLLEALLTHQSVPYPAIVKVVGPLVLSLPGNSSSRSNGAAFARGP
ncbi:MAG: hypothetical protein U1E87_06590 [Alphaproteobacteria bacterium]